MINIWWVAFGGEISSLKDPSSSLLGRICFFRYSCEFFLWSPCARALTEGNNPGSLAASAFVTCSKLRSLLAMFFPFLKTLVLPLKVYCGNKHLLHTILASLYFYVKISFYYFYIDIAEVNKSLTLVQTYSRRLLTIVIYDHRHFWLSF